MTGVPDRMASRALRWGRLLSEFATAQILGQALAAITGLLLVRYMSVGEYGLYTLALAAVTFVSVFSDLGVSGALHYFFRKALGGGIPFAGYVAAALDIRRRLLLAGWLFALVYVGHTGSTLGFGWADLAIILAMIAGATWLQVDASIALIRLRLEQRYRQSYVAELVAHAARLALVVAGLAAIEFRAWMAVLVNALGFALTARGGRAISGPVPQAASRELAGDIRRRVFRLMLPTSLGSIYFALQAPIVVWICSHFGNLTTVAEVGAIGRLGAIFGLITGFVSSVLVPRLSAVTDDTLYLRRYMEGWLALLVVGGLMVAASLAVPEWLIFLLGSAYAGLTNDVVIVTLTAVIMTWGGFATAVKHARGWVRNQFLVIMFLVIAQVGFAMFIDLSTTRGVLLFQLATAIALLFVEVSNNLLGFARPAWLSVDRP